MSPKNNYRERVESCLRRFLASTGREKLDFDGRADLIQDLGLSSDEGVDFVLDLCDSFKFEFPTDFNPFIHEDGCRGRRVDEMVDAIEQLLSGAEVAQ